MAVITVKVWWDAICPWCYIGHRTITRAIELYQKTYPGGSQDSIVFDFQPYYRSPDAPVVGVEWEEAVANKNGPERVNAIRTRMERVGRENGILFSFGSRIGSTRDCHRMLLEFARPKGWEVEKALIEKIFEWHFERDADITSRQALAKIVVDAGVVSSEDDVLVFLEGEERAQEVDELVAQAKAKDVKHVPTFEIHGRRIEGAEDTSAFYEALAGAKDEESTVGVNGNAC